MSIDQDTLETSLLCILYEKANGRNHFYSVEAVAGSFKPPTTADRVQLGMNALVTKGFAESDPLRLQGFQITDRGVDWVESEHSINFTGEKYQFRRRKASARIDVPKVAPERWTKSAAIAGWIGVAVMVIGVIVAIILDHN